MAGKAGVMSKTQSRQMFAKIQLSKAANEDARRVADLHRLCDPLEMAKTYLRTRGWHVFAECVLGGQFWRSMKIRVGPRAMEPDEVIAMADRMRAR